MGTPGTAIARIGYAADAAGCGVVYARIGQQKPRVVRAQFRGSALNAIAAIAPLVRKHNEVVELQLDDEVVVEALNQRRELPGALLMPYIRARCALNTFRSCHVTTGKGPNDLAARARAEVSIRVAA